MRGQIIKLVSGDYTVRTAQGEATVKARGLLRHLAQKPLVGDFVELASGQIARILPRKNAFVRPPVANVDQVLIITSLTEPDLNLYLLDCLLAESAAQGAEPLLVFTKRDLLAGEPPAVAYYRKYFPVYVVPGEEAKILTRLAGKLTILAGQSGTGKSTLLNRLAPELALATATISQALGRGRHTTRTVSLYDLAGGLVADTPGFGMLAHSCPSTALAVAFPEFRDAACRFRPCTHLHEPGCAVLPKVATGKVAESRYANYKRLYAEACAREKAQKEGGKLR